MQNDSVILYSNALPESSIQLALIIMLILIIILIIIIIIIGFRQRQCDECEPRNATLNPHNKSDAT